MDAKLITWILDNGDMLLNLLFAIVAIIAAIVQNWSSVKATAYEGMLGAKRRAKDGLLASGQEQEDWVVSTFYPRLPAQVRLFVREATFRAIVKKLYAIAKDAADGSIDGKTDLPAGG